MRQDYLAFLHDPVLQRKIEVSDFFGFTGAIAHFEWSHFKSMGSRYSMGKNCEPIWLRIYIYLLCMAISAGVSGGVYQRFCTRLAIKKARTLIAEMKARVPADLLTAEDYYLWMVIEVKARQLSKVYTVDDYIADDALTENLVNPRWLLFQIELICKREIESDPHADKKMEDSFRVTGGMPFAEIPSYVLQRDIWRVDLNHQYKFLAEALLLDAYA